LAGGGAVRLCPTIDDFFDHGGGKISTLAIAGVGRSALGSAAFTRNVAEATGRSAAAVVSGYGLADAATEALYGLVEHHAERAQAFAKTVRIITVSARIYMPRPFRDIVDVMGEWDWFGEMNSRPDLKVDVSVKGAWHHTNTEIPTHLPVTQTLRGILA
jgi:hypothetical protein